MSARTHSLLSTLKELIFRLAIHVTIFYVRFFKLPTRQTAGLLEPEKEALLIEELVSMGPSSDKPSPYRLLELLSEHSDGRYLMHTLLS